jgi:hypothetical protein
MRPFIPACGALWKAHLAERLDPYRVYTVPAYRAEFTLYDCTSTCTRTVLIAISLHTQSLLRSGFQNGRIRPLVE